ncbi:unnamed protein product [Haemonchus placei]|uniref:Small monomeric GTPase n=1 Tax=Haemonchus placei TaxID=6290 RepID=A0A0N4X6W7_HAEPC|nr:unnamed protein product [Haemonchus placei]
MGIIQTERVPMVKGYFKGIVGTTSSGKTSLVHRYLTGTFTAEESPEGGRFKKEVFIDGLSHLLLIRDEGSASPDVQFSLWADAVIFVYSVDNQDSFERVRHFYSHMNKFRNVADMPVLLVGTKDTLSEKNPRVISEEEGKQMANHLKRCAYYETCATYGLNVERVFKDGKFFFDDWGDFESHSEGAYSLNLNVKERSFESCRVRSHQKNEVKKR